MQRHDKLVAAVIMMIIVLHVPLALSNIFQLCARGAALPFFATSCAAKTGVYVGAEQDRNNGR